MAYQNDEDRVADLIHRMQVYAFPRRLRMKEFFNNFDKLKCGRCTTINLGRALNTAGVKVSDEEVSFLAEHFTMIGPNVQKPQVVDYVTLCDAVEKIFNDGDISFKPPNDMMSSMGGGSMMQTNQSMMTSTMGGFVPNDVEDEDLMNHIMHRLASLCNCRGICFKLLYHDFERGPSPSPSNVNPRRGGKCTAAQFKRLFPFKKEFSEDDIELLMNRYKTVSATGRKGDGQGGDVHFQAIHNDISEVMNAEPPPFPTSDLWLKPDTTQWDHMTLNPVKKIQCKVVEKRVRLTEYFADFDPLRKGFCTAGQLKTVLTILDLSKEIDRVEFNHVIEAYSRDDGMFCHALFCRDIDAAFTVPGLEKEPLATTPLPDATTTAPGRRNRMSLDKGKKKKIQHIEAQIKTKISQQRILMKPFFEDMDKARKGLVTRNQFMRIMNTQLFFSLSEQDVAHLAGVYCDRGNHNDFNYRDFIKACDPEPENEAIAMSQLNSPYQDQAPSKYFLEGGRVKAIDRCMSP